MAPPDRRLAAIFEQGDDGAGRLAAEAHDRISAADRRAVDADEALRIEPALERGQRGSREARRSGRVDPCIIAVGLDPGDLYARVAASARGRWQRYRAQLAPVLHQLARWCEEMGYET